MKYFIVTIYLVAIIAFFDSCKKDGDIEDSTFIFGTWELRLAQNGMVPTIEYSSGNGNLLKFSDSEYERYTNGNLVKKGHYIIVRDASVMAETGLVIPSGQFINRIIFDSDFASHKTFIEVSNNRLTFLSGFFPLDGGSHVLYERQENNH